jgi:hypothetical protein
MSDHDVHHRLAHGAFAAVDACSCDAIHVHVGTVTLHLTRDALRSIAHTLMAATMRLEQRRGGVVWATRAPPGSC